MPRRLFGFTLVEIMIALAIVAVLVALAFPAYQRYMLKAKLSDVIEYTEVVKLAFTEFYEETGECPTPQKAGLKVNSPIPHIATVSHAWDRNPCQKWFEAYLEIDGDSEPALKDLDRDRVMLRGTIGNDGSVSWTCGFSRYTPEIKDYLPQSCQAGLI